MSEDIVDEDILLDGDENWESYRRLYYTTTNGEKVNLTETSWIESHDSYGVVEVYSGVAIPDETFKDQATLKTLTTHAFVGGSNEKHIGDDCFNGCTNLEQILIYGNDYSSITIGERAFVGCDNLKTVVIGSYWYNSIDSCHIEASAFSGCNAITHLQGQDNIVEVGQEAFNGCTGLHTLALCKCSTFAKKAFDGCTGLRRIMVRGDISYPTSSSNADDVFNGCNGITEVIILGSPNVSDGLVQLMRPIHNNNGGDIIVRVDQQYVQTYEYVWQNAYSGETWYDNLSANAYNSEYDVILASESRDCLFVDDDPPCSSRKGVLETAIACGWLKYCTRTLTVFEAQNIKKIDIKPVVIDGVTLDDFFREGTNGPGGQSNPHYVPDISNPTYVTQFTYDKEKILIDFSCFQLFNKTVEIADEAFKNCYVLNNIVLPESIKIIGDNAFYDCDALTGITIPEGVEQIGEGMIESCNSVSVVFNAINCADMTESLAGNDSNVISSITIGNNVLRLPAHVFQDADDITSVTIPSSVEEIGEAAFDECDNITTITIGSSTSPSSLVSIGDNAFQECGWFNGTRVGCTVTIYADTPPTLGEYVFEDAGIRVIKVPSGSVDTYKAAPGWSDFSSKIESI